MAEGDIVFLARRVVHRAPLNTAPVITVIKVTDSFVIVPGGTAAPGLCFETSCLFTRPRLSASEARTLRDSLSAWLERVDPAGDAADAADATPY